MKYSKKWAKYLNRHFAKTKHTEKADKYMKKIILVFIFISLQANAN